MRYICIESLEEMKEPEIVTKITEMTKELNIDYVRNIFEDVLDNIEEYKSQKALEKKVNEFKKLTPEEQKAYLSWIENAINAIESNNIIYDYRPQPKKIYVLVKSEETIKKELNNRINNLSEKEKEEINKLFEEPFCFGEISGDKIFCHASKKNSFLNK